MPTAVPPPTLDELHKAFVDLLDRAAAHGSSTPVETWLHPAVLDAIDSVARAWPEVDEALIAKAHRRFARYERAHTSATSTPTRWR